MAVRFLSSENIDGSLQIGSGHNTASAGNAVIFASYGSGTNIAGGDMQIYGGRSTGSAAGGSIKFYTSPTGSSGSGTNAHIQALSIDSSQNATFAGDVTLSAAGSTGAIIRTTDNTEPFFALQRNSGSNGVGVLRLLDGGDLTFDTGATGAGQSTRLTIDGSNGNATFAGQVHIDSKPNSGLAYNVLIDVGSSGDGTIGYQTVDQLAANLSVSSSSNWVKSGNDIYNTNSGSVGIGTASPDRSLDVQEALSIFGSGGTTEIMLRGQVEGTGTVRNVGSFHWSIRGDIGGNNDDLKLVRFVTGSYVGIAMQVQNSTGDIFFGNTVVNPASGFSDQRGFGYDNSTGNVEIAATSGNALTVGRNESSDGTIMTLRKESNVKHAFGSTTSYLLGNVGIGVTSPARPLHVNGVSTVARFQGSQTGYTQGSIVLHSGTADSPSARGQGTYRYNEGTDICWYTGTAYSDTNKYIWARRTGVTSFATDAGEGTAQAGYALMTLVGSSGNVGIGTASPSEILQTNKNSAGNVVGGYFTNSQANTGAEQVSLAFGLNRSGGDFVRQVKAITFGAEQQWTGTPSTVDGFLSFSTVANETVAERMRITSAGDITVSGGDLFLNSGTNYNDKGVIYLSNERTAIISDIVNLTANGDTSLDFQTRSGGNRSSAMFINEFRRVGIGTNSPLSKFQVSESVNRSLSSSEAQMRIEGNGYSAFFALDGTSFQIGQNSNFRDMTFHSGASSANILERMRITAAGNVGIGYTSPGYSLEIASSGSAGRARVYADGNGAIYSANGDVQLWTNNTAYAINFYSANKAAKILSCTNAGSVTVTGDLVAYGSPSDKRLKENIKPIESALDKVSKLQGVTFDWKKSDSILHIKEDIGFIAQDVQKVIPELVRENGDGMLSMRHQGIAPILLEAIKELKQEIQELKSQIQ